MHVAVAKTTLGALPFDILQAVLGGHHFVVRQLFDAGVTLLQPDDERMTLLVRAVLREHPKLVKLLLKLGHPVDQLDGPA